MPILLNILICEDERLIALDLCSSIVKMGFKVIGISHSAKELIHKAKDLLPDLILTDISLPGDMSGIEAIKIIKAWRNIPCIYISGLKDENTFKEAMETEPCAFLTKPYNFLELKSQIEKCVQVLETKEKIINV